jgi:hypothetical protein
MWKSSKTGTTLSDIKKSETGKDNLVRTLLFIGIPEENIHVYEQEKVYKYVPKTKKKKGGNK